MRTRDDVNRYLTPLSFFKLFFTVDLVQHLCNYTNTYARLHGPAKKTLYKGWTDVTVDDMYMYFALLMYMAVVNLPNVECYWKKATLFHGLWARYFMSKLKFKAIQSFLKVCNAETENNKDDKLCKVRFLHDYIRRKCMKHYQPYQNVSVDERMVRNKGRFTFRQFIKDKPTRWGMKLWVLADAKNGYTYNFEVYTGKGTPVGPNGLGFDVVTRITECLQNQGYHVYFDNYYSGVALARELRARKLLCCGTLLTNRKGVPADLKDTKKFSKGQRGDARWKREDDLLFLQWQDNKAVTFLSTIHTNATQHGYVDRRTKVKGAFRPVHVKQPQVVKDYNTNMSGVDRSDQLIGRYETLRKTHRWWKTLFFHFLDVARVNAYILFTDFRQKHPDVPELAREDAYNQLDFTVELIRELAKIKEDEEVPLVKKKEAAPEPAPAFNHQLMPDHGPKARNCVLCYAKEKKERKTLVKCSTCDKHYCFNSTRNCLVEAHLN
jgi:hypothetical protein